MNDLVLEYRLDAPPEKVWRAISIPEFREKWLPGKTLDGAVSAVPGEEIRYKMREPEPPFLESLVTFQLRSDASGGTILRIEHVLMPRAANSNRPLSMRAA